jgi:hypothetical protein
MISKHFLYTKIIFRNCCVLSHLDLMPLEGFAVLTVGGVAQEQVGDDLNRELAVLVKAERRIAPLRLFDVTGAAAR